MRKINWRVVFGIALSVAVLILILNGVSLPDLAAELARGNYWWFLPSTVIMVAALWFRAIRWRILLDGQLPLGRAYHILNAGNFLNNVLPLRLGEVCKAYLASRNSPVTAMQGLSAVLIERILDVLTMFLFLIAVLPLVPSQGLIVQAGQAAAGIAVLAIVILLAAAALRERAMAAAGVLTGWLPVTIRAGILRRGDDFLRGVSAASGWRLGLAVFWSLLIWVAWGISTWLGLLVFLPASSWHQAVFLTCAQALGLSIPSAPSGAGIYEAATIAGLAVFGVSKETALAVGLTGHIFSFVITAVSGVIGLDREGEKFGHLITAAQNAMTAVRR